METETETNMKICMYKDFVMEMCNMILLFSLTLLFLVLLIFICPSNILQVNENFYKLERVYRDCIKRTRDKTRIIQYTA